MTTQQSFVFEKSLKLLCREKAPKFQAFSGSVEDFMNISANAVFARLKFWQFFSKIS